MNKIPTKGEYLEVILRSTKTIFSTKDAALLWNENDNKIVTDRLKKYVNAGKLVRPYRGFYAKDQNYDRFELATRIYTPSYISFETVLTREGVNFQYYGNIFVASYVNREINVADQKIKFVRTKDYVLSNTTGIDHKDGYAVATRERAFLDRLYVSKDYHFDNLRSLDWNKVMEILPIYNNKRLEKKVKEYKKIIEERSGVSYKQALEKCIAILESMDNKHILDGLGELLTDSQKDSARAKLRTDTIFLLKVMHSNEK
jgi:hypothetical protein